MSFTPSVIATLATGPAIEDLRILLKTLGIFNTNPPTVYLFCDSKIADSLSTIDYAGPLIHKVCLDPYSNRSRRDMELEPGKQFKNLWFDFMVEKIRLLRWVFEAGVKDVMFCDADICFTGPLPEIPIGCTLALSPHEIRHTDELKYGRYNGGYLWVGDVGHVEAWWKACAAARFYEQSALEDVTNNVPDAELYEFPITENYGWWRLWQGVDKPEIRMEAWGISRTKGGSGITVAGKRLGSVHTHFHEKYDGATMAFNSFVVGFLKKLAPVHPPAKRLLAAIQ
jgi:hypothetical protein